MGGEDPKYTGPHQNMRCTADSKMGDWYSHDETENKDVKADGKTTMDAKWKHKSGYVRYKLYSSWPKVGENHNLEFTDDKQVRFEWQGLKTTMDFKKDVFSKEVDFGTFHSNSWFMNPYTRWESNTSFKDNSLAAGMVLRYGDWMFRQEVEAQQIHEAEDKLVGDVLYSQKGKFVKDEFTLEWTNRANITKMTHDRWKLLAHWANKDYGAVFGLTSKHREMPEPSLFLRYRACDKTSVGAHYTYMKTKADPNHWHIGMKYVGDKNTTCRVMTNNELNCKMNVTHRLSDKNTMMFTFGHNLKSWVNGSKAYEKGFLGYPWSYGLVFKLED